MTSEQDLVIIYLEDQPMSFARVEEIIADHKKNWYHVTLLMLQIPVQEVTWILRDVYIDGAEFTMDGKRLRLEKVKRPVAHGQDSFEEEDVIFDDDDKVISQKIFTQKKINNNHNQQNGKVKTKNSKNPIKKSTAKVISLADLKKK